MSKVLKETEQEKNCSQPTAMKSEKEMRREIKTEMLKIEMLACLDLKKGSQLK